mmetsp:Transcript_4457/g.6601  ORF Transcript_4457/g.6601 Transcript_4457/m.6601 type:complete len:109 (-) Transcript_4457:24-350(-)
MDTGRIDRVIAGLSRTRYDPSQLAFENSCKICLQEYSEDDELTNLKCDPRHVFHSECINRWIQEGHDDCPFCRSPIDNIESLRGSMMEEGGGEEHFVIENEGSQIDLD